LSEVQGEVIKSCLLLACVKLLTHARKKRSTSGTAGTAATIKQLLGNLT